MGIRTKQIQPKLFQLPNDLFLSKRDYYLPGLDRQSSQFVLGSVSDKNEEFSK